MDYVYIATNMAAYVSSWLGTTTGVVAAVAAIIIAVCALVAMFLQAPTEGSSTGYRVLYAVINVLAANRLAAANADEAVTAGKKVLG